MTPESEWDVVAVLNPQSLRPNELTPVMSAIASIRGIVVHDVTTDGHLVYARKRIAARRVEEEERSGE